MVMNNGAAEGVKNTDPQPSRRDLTFSKIESTTNFRKWFFEIFSIKQNNFFVNLKLILYESASRRTSSESRRSSRASQISETSDDQGFSKLGAFLSKKLSHICFFSTSWYWINFVYSQLLGPLGHLLLLDLLFLIIKSRQVWLTKVYFISEM